MTILTESERKAAEILADKGLSFNEITERILCKRAALIRRPMAEEVAAIFGRRMKP